MKTYRSTGSRILVTAGGTRTSGQAAIDNNFAGFAETDAASGAKYWLRISGEFEIAFIASSVIGDTVLINDSTLALTRVAYDAAVSAGTRAFAKVTAVPGAGITAPASGLMWVKLLEQTNALGAAATG